LSGQAPIVGDFNRDGKSDIWWYPGNGTTGPTTKWPSTSTGTFTVSAGPTTPGGGWKQAGVQNTLAGLPTSMVTVEQTWIGVSSNPSTLWLTNPDISVTSINTSTFSTNALAADFNADGFSDLRWVGNSLWLGSGSGTFSQAATDGKTDILWDQHSGSDTRSAGQRVLWLSGSVASDLVTSVTTGHRLEDVRRR
jgi:hypothetical protein